MSAYYKSGDTAPSAFVLTGSGMQYRMHLSDEGEVIHDHFGSHATYMAPSKPVERADGWTTKLGDEKRELPDLGRGDFCTPAIQIKTGEGHCITSFKFIEHQVGLGKSPGDVLPATFGKLRDASTLKLNLCDEESKVEVDAHYAVFPKYDAITRSLTIANEGDKDVEIKRASSFVLNLEPGDWDMVQLSGDWAREAHQSRRPVHIGTQGFQSLQGFSSQLFNPFLAIVASDATETSGEVYGLSLIYSGSFLAEVEKYTSGHIRAQIGLNPLHLDWKLPPGEWFKTPECVAVYSNEGLGGLSRKFHRLYRDHLSASKWTHVPRPVLLNSWEGMYFDFDAAKLYKKAQRCAELGIKLFVMDDGWFGNKHPRLSDKAGLGDWVANPQRFPDGLGPFVQSINSLTSRGEPLKFGIWVEPEMVNPASELYEAHPDWVLHAGKHKRTEQRNQLVLDLSKQEVQDYIIDKIGDILSSANIAYVKWDCNRAIHETPHSSTPYAYMIGFYRVLDTLTKRFPDILWEGCASGGGRFDPGILHYFCQSWTSDDTDAIERLHIQFGTSLVYPASSMGCHVSAVPNHQVGRVTPLEFRAHVALMGGSFGFELDLDQLPEEERKAIPAIIELSERVQPFVLHGDQYRLAQPDTNYPAVAYLGHGEGVIFAYQMAARLHMFPVPIKLQGLEASARYLINEKVYSGAELMNVGLKLKWERKDFQSQVLFIQEI